MAVWEARDSNSGKEIIIKCCHSSPNDVVLGENMEEMKLKYLGTVFQHVHIEEAHFSLYRVAYYMPQKIAGCLR